MNKALKAFEVPIKNGLIRIFLRISSVTCTFENDAPDFIDVEDDHPKLRVIPEAGITELTDAFNTMLELNINNRQSSGDRLVWEVEAGGIWFDIPMEEVKQIWVSEFSFHIESEKPRYLAYYIKDVDHKIEWLQKDEKSGEIRSLSVHRKSFKPNPLTDRESYSGAEIIRCADMIGRAAKKIDIRTGSALVKFNTDKGRLESLIIGIAEKLGYEVSPLDKDTIAKQNERDHSVSHMISLK
ncbi:hypothetical protein ACKGJO_00380 [Gracilimonas sp. Q87]|uniref:hypothetical protein n=1 Tax=Gracilimonas sp. Q87 TaxID=3384766 RepID=UPI00398415EA